MTKNELLSKLDEAHDKSCRQACAVQDNFAAEFKQSGGIGIKNPEKLQSLVNARPEAVLQQDVGAAPQPAPVEPEKPEPVSRPQPSLR